MTHSEKISEPEIVVTETVTPRQYVAVAGLLMQEIDHLLKISDAELRSSGMTKQLLREVTVVLQGFLAARADEDERDTVKVTVAVKDDGQVTITTGGDDDND